MILATQLHNNTHTTIKPIVVAGLFMQPFRGYFHHWRFVRMQKPVTWTRVHVWYGRALILLRLVDGGLGLATASVGAAGVQ